MDKGLLTKRSVNTVKRLRTVNETHTCAAKQKIDKHYNIIKEYEH